MTLIIDRVRLHHGRMPVKLHFSYGPQNSAGFVIAEIEAAGHVGTGEGLGIDAAHAAGAARQLIGRDARDLDALLPPPPDPWRFADSVPREMFSIALHDLVARADRQPMHALINSAAQSSLPLMPCIFAPQPDVAAQTAERFAAEGYVHFKVKLFGEHDNDAAIVRKVRSVIGSAYLQADLNGACKDKPAAIAAMQSLKTAGLDVLEDVAALPHGELADLLTVADRPRLMIDMHHRGQENLQKSLATRCAEVANLHPNCQGTISEIRERAEAFRAANITVTVGGTGYTGVGAHAHLHIAAALADNGQPYGEIGGSRDHGMPDCTATAGIGVERGRAPTPVAPGHGGQLDRNVIARYAQSITIE